MTDKVGIKQNTWTKSQMKQWNSLKQLMSSWDSANMFCFTTQTKGASIAFKGYLLKRV